MAKNTKLSVAVCSVVNDILCGSHESLEQLFISAGVPGDPPQLAHHSKWKVWLRKANDDEQTDAHSVLGKIIEEFMEVEPVDNTSDSNIFGFASEYEQYFKNKKRLVDVLGKDGLRYEKGGKLIPIPKGFGMKSLSESLKRREFHQLEIEFKRALENIERDPAAAITASCSILEALFTAYLEVNLLELPKKRSIKPLWVKVQNHLGIDPKSQSDQDIQKILTGLSSVVDGIAGFRTHAGSAHGGGILRYRVKPRHAKLAVNSSHTLAVFVIEAWEEKYSETNSN